MNAGMMTRNIVIGNRRTTIRLEGAMWDAFDEICQKLEASPHDICTQIDNERSGVNRAQAIRAAVVKYLRLSLNTNTSASEAFKLALKTSAGTADQD
ncbi:MAG: ribbon-helix-helix domain-containing protein [Rhodospirillales bacterium]|nr:ribbon-helix-helix domain-containing protein [Rhodospirillales bacterium]